MKTPFAALLLLSGAACATLPAERASGGLDDGPTQPDYDTRAIERSLTEDMRIRFGGAMVAEARAAGSHVLARRFTGGIPIPPPPGATTPPPPPAMAMLMKRGSTWLRAETTGWRAAWPHEAAQIEAIAASKAFIDEPAHTPPCPDYGRAELIMRLDGGQTYVRDTGCPTQTDRMIASALAS